MLIGWGDADGEMETSDSRTPEYPYRTLLGERTEIEVFMFYGFHPGSGPDENSDNMKMEIHVADSPHLSGQKFQAQPML